MLSQIISVIIAGVIGYLLGSVNFALVISKLWYHKDIREYGSGNAGMTNMLRTFGKTPAIITIFGDFSKGIIAILIARVIFTYTFGVDGFIFGDAIVGICALLGHVFPIYYGFKGGKGILVTAGVLLMIDWVVFLLAILVFLIAFLLTRIISAGSIAAAIAYPIFNFIKGWLVHTEWFYIIVNTILAIFIACLILFMHRGNIKRLIEHTEPKIGK